MGDQGEDQRSYSLSRPLSTDNDVLWHDTIGDVEEGSCIGSFSEDEVTNFFGTDRWVPTQRIEKNKVRGCVSATVNLVNQVIVVTEKLELPSTDQNVAAIRSLATKAGVRDLAAWVLGERKAYRQVGISPDHRKYSGVAFRRPGSGVIAFFVMIGHSFGLVAAVYNYNRRSAMIDEFLRNIFCIGLL